MFNKERPNILIFMTDQEQAQVTHPNHGCKKKNLDRIAEKGVRFTSAYPPMALCSPARSSFMTGLYPSQHGVYNNVANEQAIHTSLNPGVETWSEKLKAAEYQLYFAGKWGVSATENPSDRGWERLTASSKVKTNSCRNSYLNKMPYSDTTERMRGEIKRPGWPPYRLYGISKQSLEETEDYRSVSRVHAKLNELKDQTEPWCIYIGLYGTHDPFIVSKSYATMYDPNDIELPPNYHDPMLDKPGIYRRMRKVFSQLSEQEVREAIAHYWGYCTMVDDLFGSVLDTLEKNGQLDNTWIVYLADHGEHMGAHGLFCKGISQFDEGYRIPLVISHPQYVKDPGRTVDDFVTLMDVGETIIQLSGSEQLSKSSGKSLVPFLEGEQPKHWPDSVYSQCNGTELYYTSRAVRTKKYKFVYGPVDQDELYDLEQDPYELNNIAKDPVMLPVKRQMYERMWRHAFESEDINFVNYITVSTGDYGPHIIHT